LAERWIAELANLTLPLGMPESRWR
jgi:hypothetical protein